MRESATVPRFDDGGASAGEARQFKMQNADIKLQNGGPGLRYKRTGPDGISDCRLADAASYIVSPHIVGWPRRPLSGSPYIVGSSRTWEQQMFSLMAELDCERPTK